MGFGGDFRLTKSHQSYTRPLGTPDERDLRVREALIFDKYIPAKLE